MVSSAIWKKHARVSFSKTIKIEVFEKRTHECMFLQIARETILLLINIHEKIMQSLLKTPKCLFFCIISAGNCRILLARFVIVSYFIGYIFVIVSESLNSQ